ncbi:hypothetical protein ACIHCQ_16805 [Streptomyces sp. NPDC052236]|uniref:hypothetical protein n=1 Tax=Streptomyces sp. NPDC052236 TaxID=3365686 RepID=UPI0037CDE3F5
MPCGTAGTTARSSARRTSSCGPPRHRRACAPRRRVLPVRRLAYLTVELGSIGARPDDRIRELWTHTDIPHDGHCVRAGLPAHGAALYRLTPPDTTD